MNLRPETLRAPESFRIQFTTDIYRTRFLAANEIIIGRQCRNILVRSRNIVVSSSTVSPVR